MKKIPCLYKRDFTDQRNPILLREVTPGCEWALAGEGIATRKWDGTACAVIGGKIYARYDAKRGKPAPVGGIPCDEPDPITGHHPHWVDASTDPQFKFIREAFDNELGLLPDGTYEAIGPKINGNHDGAVVHQLLKHGDVILEIGHVDFDSIWEYLAKRTIEGIVFHHPYGRMCKITRRNYGMEWPVVDAS